MMNDDEFIIMSLFISILFCLNMFYFIRNRYDLNALYRGQYLMLQETIVMYTETQCCFIIMYSDSVIVWKIVSNIYLVCHFSYFITYLLFVYRLILLNKVEFGNLDTASFLKVPNKLRQYKTAKFILFFTIICSIPSCFIYTYYSGNKSVFVFANKPENKNKALIDLFLFIYYFVMGSQFIAYTYLLLRVIHGKYRVTIKIEIICNYIVWALYFTCRFSMTTSQVFKLLLPIRNICLNVIIIISFKIRSHFNKAPDPPALNIGSMFIYENKLLYDFFHKYLSSHEDKKYVSLLELGLYINMHMIKPKNKYYLAIQNLCSSHELPQYSLQTRNFIQMIIFNMIEYHYSDFFYSTYFKSLKQAMEKNRIVLWF